MGKVLPMPACVNLNVSEQILKLLAEIRYKTNYVFNEIIEIIMNKFIYYRIVRRHELDLMGLLQSSNYFRYMEECECAFFRSLGMSFYQSDSKIVFPRVSTSLQIFTPIKNNESILISTFIKKLGRSCMTFHFDFFYHSSDQLVADHNKIIASGEYVIVSSIYDENKKKLVSTPIDNKMKSKILKYVSAN